MAEAKMPKPPILHIGSDVIREIRRHARSNNRSEVCGILVGTESNGATSVKACIAGANAAQSGAHVTFTQDTWEHIYKSKDRDYPNDRIVGWYHSHPGFGIFLSDHDMFIHKNFFFSPQQVAWIYDPNSDEEGCFGWRGEHIERLKCFSIADETHDAHENTCVKQEPNPGGEIAGRDCEEDMHACESGKKHVDLSRLANIACSVFAYLSVFILGVLFAWYFLPRILVMPVPVDPNTGQPLSGFENPALRTPGNPGALQPQPNPGRQSGSSDQPGPKDTRRGDDHR
jgi:proteasome lid subunit RPN8/RPN11